PPREAGGHPLTERGGLQGLAAESRESYPTCGGEPAVVREAPRAPHQPRRPSKLRAEFELLRRNSRDGRRHRRGRLLLLLLLPLPRLGRPLHAVEVRALGAVDQRRPPEL